MFVFGLGIMLSIGVIVTFDRVRESVMDGMEDRQVEILTSKITRNLYSLEHSDYKNEYSYGRISLKLPERIGGSDYTVDLNRSDLIISVGAKEYQRDFKGMREYYISGSASGGEATIVKQGNQIELSGR